MIESDVLKIRLVEVVSESLFEVNSQALIDEVEERVNKGSRNSYESQVAHAHDKHFLVALNYRLYYCAVESSYVDTQVGPQHQENSQQAQVQHFLALPGRNHYLQKSFNSGQENTVYLSAPALLHTNKTTLFLFLSSLRLMWSVDDFLFFM